MKQKEVFKITGSFNTKSSFSSLDLIWERYYHSTKQGYLAVKCQYLFNFNPDNYLRELKTLFNILRVVVSLFSGHPQLPFVLKRIAY